MTDQRPVERSQPVASWAARFANALRGVGVAFATECSFHVHLPVAVVVAATGAWIGLSAERWCLLVLCIATVLAAELLNSAIERLARAVTQEHSPHVRDALDMASGAVLTAAIGAATVGLIALAPPLWEAVSALP